MSGTFDPDINLLHFVTVPYLHSYCISFIILRFFDLSIPAHSILTINATAWRPVPQDFYVCRGLLYGNEVSYDTKKAEAPDT